MFIITLLLHGAISGRECRAYTDFSRFISADRIIEIILNSSGGWGGQTARHGLQQGGLWAITGCATQTPQLEFPKLRRRRNAAAETRRRALGKGSPIAMRQDSKQLSHQDDEI